MSKKKKIKKRKIILEELDWMLERNKNFCIRNDIEPTPYIEGVNDTVKKMKKFIKKLYR